VSAFWSEPYLGFIGRIDLLITAYFNVIACLRVVINQPNFKGRG